MHSPEPWGKSSAPLNDLEWANLKARIYATIKAVPYVQDRALMCQHFPAQAPFVTRVVGELAEEGVIEWANGGLRVI